MSVPLLSLRRNRLSRLLLLLVLLLGSRLSQAQVDAYVFTPSQGTFTPLPATATAVPVILADDVISGDLPIGFTFNFDGLPYTQLRASSNGFLSFNLSATSNRFNDGGFLGAGAATEKPLLAPLWDDLDGRPTGATASASYLTTGTAGSRVFTFEWLNWEWRYTASAAIISFQVKLYEGSNRIEFIYRQEAPGPLDTPTASIGIASSVSGTPAATSFLSLNNSSAAPVASSTVETNTIATSPATGQVYAFTPPAPSACPTPRNLSATVTNTTANLSWTVLGGTGPYTVLYGPAGFNPALPSSGTNQYTTRTGLATATLALTGLTPNTAYQFYVTQNCGGTAGNSNLSNAGAFTTNPNPPTNDDCATAITLPMSTTCTTPTAGGVFGATQSQAPTTGCGGTTANDVWYSFTATATSHTINFTGQFAAAYDVRTGTCTTSTSVYCTTVAATTPSNNTIGGLTIGQLYFIRVYANGTAPVAASSGFTLCITPGPATPTNDDCAGAINVPVQYGTCVAQTSADNTAATNSTGVPAPTCANYQEKDIWFMVTVPASGAVTIQTLPPTAGSNVIDTGLSVYSGTCGNLTQVGCDDDSNPTGAYSLLALTGRTPGEVLYIRVWEYGGGTTGLIAVCVTSPSNCAVPLAPAAGNLSNTTASLSWTRGGTPNPGDTFEIEYGLQGFTLGTGTTITGLTTPSYQLTGLTANTQYCYYVRQNCGTANGSSAYVGPTCFTTSLTAPANDDPCGAILLTSSGPITASNVGATTSGQSGISTPACSPAVSPQDVWFAITPSSTSTTLNMTGTAAGMVRIYSSPSCSAGPFTLVACQSSGAATAGLPSMTATGLTPGQRYYVAVSGYGGASAPGTFTIAGTALATKVQAESKALLVYPNPSNTGQLTLRLSKLGKGEATLLNALGQSVRTQALSSGTAEQTISTRGLATGVYTLRVQIGDDILTRKVVLE
jgi:hypothetical protein